MAVGRNSVTRFGSRSVARRESIGEKIEAALQDVDAKKVAVNGSARGILQQVANAKEGQNQLFGEGAVDLTLLYHPMVRTTLFIDFEAIAGPGPDRKLGSLSRVNADAETLGDQDEKLTVREGWLWLQFINDRLDFFVGKLDLTNYFDRNVFANDETTQFLNAALVNNPMLKQPANSAGVTLRWDAGRDLGFSLGGQTHPRFWMRISLSEPFVIGEIDYHSTFLIEGNYRLWVRVSSFAGRSQAADVWGRYQYRSTADAAAWRVCARWRQSDREYKPDLLRRLGWLPLDRAAMEPSQRSGGRGL